MAERIHLRVFGEGRDAVAKWRAENPDGHLDLTGVQFEGQDLSGFDFGPAYFDKTNLAGAKLQKCNLEGARFTEANLKGTDFTGAVLRNASLTNVNARSVVFCEADLSSATLGGEFVEADLSGANLRGARIQSVHLESSRIVGADFEGADVSNTNLGSALIDGANFRGAKLASANLHRVRRSDREAKPPCFAGANLRSATLAHADLAGADLADADLRQAGLEEANLEGALLHRAKLFRAQLSDARVTGARIRRYDLEDIKAHNYGGLLPSQIETMRVEDGYTELQLFLGGLRAWLHVTGAVLWLVPMLVLVLKALTLSIASGLLGSRVTSVPIGRQLLGYMTSGRFDPVTHADGSWSYPLEPGFFAIWLALFAYNLGRLGLVYYVKHLEHSYRVKGFHPLVDLSRWYVAWPLRVLRVMVWLSVLLAGYHFLRFLQTPFPALVR